MTRADRIVLAVLIAAAVLAVPVAASASQGNRVRLSGPAGTSHIDPARDGVFTVEGRVSDLVFEARDGSVRCVYSGCPDQLCVRAGSAKAGSPIVCAPNGVIAELSDGVGEGALDAVSR